MPPDHPQDDPGAGATEPDHQAETGRSFSMLLGTGDLPGRGWEVKEERSWPTGRPDASEGSTDARGSGGVTAWRKFATRGRPESAWVEAVPYACSEDAGLSLRQVSRYFVGVAPPGELLVDEHVVVDRMVPGVAESWVYERLSTGPAGDLVARHVAGTVDSVLVLVCLTGPPGSWAWDEVLGLASDQIEKVRRALTA